MKIGKIVLVAGASLLSACAAGPDYVRPDTAVPENWGAPAADTRVFGAWWQEFGDPELAALVVESFAHNNDIRVAVANVDAAAATLRLARAEYLPTINAEVASERIRISDNTPVPAPSAPYTQHSAGIFLEYEFDLWGRVRRANEAALAGLTRDIAVRDGIRAAVAASVARAYFESRALERQITLLERLHAMRIDDLDLQRTRLTAGLTSPYDYEQARSETAAVAAQLPALRAAHARALTALAVLRGVSPAQMFAEWSDLAPADRGAAALPAAPTVPMDLPSALLERRPDIRAAEQQLVASTARIGQAKAAYFPRLSLTGVLGGVSTALSSLFDASSRAWQAGAVVTQPLTDLNRVGANVAAAKALTHAATARYARTVQVAFEETLNALTGVTTAREIMQAQDERVSALQNAYRTAEAQYRAGSLGYLELLDVERQLREVEQQQVNAHLALLQSTVDLYRALGGGWQEAPLMAAVDRAPPD